MALTISGAGSANSTTSSATLATSSFLVSWSNPDLIVVCVAADNNGTNGAASISSVTDSKGHTYTQQRISNQDPGAAAAGATVAIYTAVATTGLVNGNTITVNFSPNTTSKAMYVWKVAAAGTEFPKFVTSGGATGATANPTVTTGSITSGDAVIGALAAETNVTPTADTDTTNGSWAGHTNATANTGTAATSMNLHTGYKITTGTGAQTWNQTLVANDWANAFIVIDAAARIDRTATGSGAGTQSAAGFKTLSRTSTGSGVGSSSATGVKFSVVSGSSSGSGVGSQSASGVRVVLRSSTGSGFGTETTSGVISRLRSATGSGTGSGSAVGVITTGSVARTATGSGAGAQSATPLVSRYRTASGSGVGGFDSTGVVIRVRTGSGSGSGAGTAGSLRVSPRTASGIGAGIGVAAGSKASVRTASGFGEGTSSTRGNKVVVLLLKPRKNVTVSKLYPTGRKPTAVQPLFPPRGRWN